MTDETLVSLSEAMEVKNFSLAKESEEFGVLDS